MQLCTPAMIYVVLSCLSLVFGAIYNFNIVVTLLQLFFILIWSQVLNYLCIKGYETISWIIVLFPFILGAFLFLKTIAR